MAGRTADVTAPTIESRLARRFLLMTTDASVAQAVEAQVPTGWEMVVVTSLDDIGQWNDILLFRFLVLDLDETEAFDPVDVIRVLRMEYLLQIAVLCFGGDADIQDEMRLSRADRFFERGQIVAALPQFFAQYNW